MGADISGAAPLQGRRALVTGGAGGLGQATARQLAALGVEVLVADCNRQRGEAAAAELQAAYPQARCTYQWLDLADLKAVQAFAEQQLQEGQGLDILVNNAGILPPLQRKETRDGFELKLGINYLGHFALTGYLLPLLLKSASPRVVTVSSIAHRMGRIHFDDLQLQRHYDPERAYNQAKLACLMYALELQRRATAAGCLLLSLAAHPGVARTGIGDSRRDQPITTLRQRLADMAFHLAMRFCSQSTQQGAQPLLLAATGAAMTPGGFYGPDGFLQMRGKPVRVQPSRRAADPDAGRRLWEMAETLTGVVYRFEP